MTQLILLGLSLTIGFTFLTMTHPLAMGLILLCQTLLISLMTGLLAPSFWFSYILFLVFLGGMLVLFIYVTSLASNEMFSISAQTFVFSAILLTAILSVTYVNDPSLWGLTNYTDQIQPLHETNPTQPLLNLLIKLYNSPTHLLTLLLVLYLFLTLVAVVTVTQIFQGPLRSKN